MADYRNNFGMATAYARELLASVATARNWSAGWLAVGEACILQAEQRTDECVNFWDMLCYYWFMVDESQAPGGWKELGRAYEAAYFGAWDDVQMWWTEASTVAVFVNTTQATYDDAKDIGGALVDAANTAVDTAKKPWAWLLLAALIIGVKAR